MLGDENIRSFHVVLAQKVIKVSELNIEGRRTGMFREEFFSSNEDLLIALKETLYMEAAKNNEMHKDDIDTSILKILKQPAAENIAELIGSVLTYDNFTNTLKLNDEKLLTNNSLLSQLQVPQSVVNEAYAIAGRRKLSCLTFTLPAAFGNLDMTVTVNKKKAERRLEFLANKISDVIKESADAEGNVVLREGMYASDKRLDAGVLAINGGIAGAVGNLLVSDERNKLKFNLDLDTLGENAKKLLLKLRDRQYDLQKYRFVPESEHFPRLSLHATEREKRFVMDFLDNLYFYTCQAKEDKLEEIATKELQTYECNDSFNKAESRIRANTLFLKVHSEIQIWWMTEQTVPYLTRDTFNKIFGDFVNKGLLSFLNYIYLNDMRNVDLEFVPDAIEVLSVCGRDTPDAKMIVVHTEVHMLTCHKLVQYFKNAEDYIFLDIDYLVRMSSYCLKMVTDELAETNIRNVVLICKDVSKCNDVIRACGTRKIIVITTNTYVFTGDFISIRDERINLSDLTEASQYKVLQTEFNYQGTEVTFAEVFDEDSKHLINSKVLEKIINKDYITLGHMLTHSTYEAVKTYYVPRSLQHNTKFPEKCGIVTEDMFSPTTLIDHHVIFKRRREKTHDVVLVLDAPGMGKSTLLTHLSLETKRRYPKIWIQRINLIDHTKQFHDWHENKVEVDSGEALRFVCKIVLAKESSSGNIRVAKNDNNIDLAIVDGEIKITNREESALVAFTLNTFLYCFKKGQVIFLFDGFDEICPHYKRNVTQLLKCLARGRVVRNSPDECCEQQRTAPCVWITSRPYNDLRETLEKEFGESYTLQPFSYKDISAFLGKYLRQNLNLNALTCNQLKNIDGFFKYMKQCSLGTSTNFNKVLESVYVAAIQYFENEVKQFNVTDYRLKYVRSWNTILNADNTLRTFWHTYLSQVKEVPLHVYFAIHNFQNQVKDTTLKDTKKLIEQWDMETSTIVFYDRFIETKLKTIRFEEKNRMDIYNPDVKLTYEKEKKEFLDKHKKLAFYIICDKHNSKSMLTSDELDEVKDIIKRMKVGEDKTGLIDSIVNDVPRFVHFTFVEYFAMEYIVNSLKFSEPHKQQQMLRFILFTIYILPSYVLFSFLNLKIKSDPELLSHLNDLILVWLVNQTKHYTAFLYEAIMKGLKNLVTFLVDAAISAVDEANFEDFSFVMTPSFFSNAFPQDCYEYNQLVGRMLDCIRKYDISKIDDLYNDATSDIANNNTPGKSNEEIIEQLRSYHKRKNVVKYYYVPKRRPLYRRSAFFAQQTIFERCKL